MPRVPPMPLPTFAPIPRPVLVFGVLGFVAEDAALGVPGGVDDMDACVVVGVDVDVDEDVLIVAAIDDDHVVAERSELQLTSSGQHILFDITSCLATSRYGSR